MHSLSESNDRAEPRRPRCRLEAAASSLLARAHGSALLPSEKVVHKNRPHEYQVQDENGASPYQQSPSPPHPGLAAPAPQREQIWDTHSREASPSHLCRRDKSLLPQENVERIHLQRKDHDKRSPQKAKHRSRIERAPGRLLCCAFFVHHVAAERPGSGTAGRAGCLRIRARPSVACSRWFDHDLVLRSMHLHPRHARRVQNPTGVQSLPGSRPSRLGRCLGCPRSHPHCCSAPDGTPRDLLPTLSDDD